MKNKLIVLLAALLLILVSVPSAFSYFSTYTKTEGSKPIHLSDKTEIIETVDSAKHIVVKADQNSGPMFVRVKYFAPENKITVTPVVKAPWKDGGDGYYYYEQSIQKGEATSELELKVSGYPEEAEIDDEFHIVVVYEAVPASYNDDGTMYADWVNAEITYFEGEAASVAGGGN